MTESNNYCKKKQANTQTSNWRSFVFKLEHSKASRNSTWNIGKTSRALELGHCEKKSRARVGSLRKKVARSSWGVPKQPTARSNDSLPIS